ncbi:mitochondrial carrier domain-containing protein [Gorgonomyces haynaldii]|nr:mitochondrial carrier domain-containing protein [Gorgonomyces haynaldii]
MDPAWIKEKKITISASLSALAGVSAGYPFDSIKTRMQAHNYNTLLDCFRDVIKKEGPIGFYRGVLPVLTTAITLRSVSFNIYTTAKEKLKYGLIPNALVAGGITGTIMCSMGAPIEFIKVQRQLQNSGGNIWSWIAKIVRQKGVFGLYTGYHIHLPMDIIGVSFYFGIYEGVKQLLAHGNTPSVYASLVAGGLAGSLSWVVVFPMDVMKSVWQKQGLLEPRPILTTSQLVKQLYQEGGIPRFYKGLGPQMVRSFGVHGISFVVYEQMVKWITQLPEH